MVDHGGSRRSSSSFSSAIIPLVTSPFLLQTTEAGESLSRSAAALFPLRIEAVINLRVVKDNRRFFCLHNVAAAELWATQLYCVYVEEGWLSWWVSQKPRVWCVTWTLYTLCKCWAARLEAERRFILTSFYIKICLFSFINILWQWVLNWWCLMCHCWNKVLICVVFLPSVVCRVGADPEVLRE